MTAPEPGPHVPPPEPAALRRAAASGVAWQGLSFLGGKIVVLAATAVLARLLTPEDFGLVAFALVLISIADVVGDFGVAQALIYLPESRRRTDAALATALAFSGILVLLAFVGAPLLADFFGRTEVTDLLRVLSLALLLGATASIPEALLRKRLQFRRTVGANLAKAAVTGAVSVGLALAGAGPWALVWGQLAGLLVLNVVLWSLVDHRPDLRLWRVGWDEASPLVRYGLSVASAMLLSKLVFDVDYIVVGRALGAEELGYYTLAFRLPELGIISVFFVISAVAFPVYRQAAGDRARLQRGYLSAVRLQSAYGAAAGAGLAVLAPAVVLVVFGPQWRPSTVPLTALAVYAALRSLGAGANDVYKALGRPALAVWMSLLRLALLVPALVYATRWGIEGVAWAQAAVAGVLVVLMQGLAARVLGLSPLALVRAMLPALVLAVGVALGAGAVRLALDGSPWLTLLLGLPAGAGGGLLALRLAAPGFLAGVTGTVRARAGRTGA